jgi:E1-E2 ATPase
VGGGAAVAVVLKRSGRVRSGAPRGEGGRGARPGTYLRSSPSCALAPGRVIDTAELVPGDIALVEEGERIAADMRLISGAVEVGLSTLTGESVLAMRSAEYHDRDRPRLEARELLFSGSMCTGGDAQAVVFATGMHTELGRIAALSQGVKEEPSPLDQPVRSPSDPVLRQPWRCRLDPRVGCKRDRTGAVGQCRSPRDHVV